MSCRRYDDGKAFHTRGPAAKKLLSPKLLCARGTTHILSEADRAWKRRAMPWQRRRRLFRVINPTLFDCWRRARTCLVVRTSWTGYDANSTRNLTPLYICIPIDVNRVCLAGSLGDHSRMSSVGECLVTNKDRLSLSNPLDVLHHGERAANE